MTGKQHLQMTRTHFTQLSMAFGDVQEEAAADELQQEVEVS